MKKYIILTLFVLVSLLLISGCSAESPHADIAEKTYLYEKDGFGGSFTIQLRDDGSFTYYEGMLSSYIGIGSWTLVDGIVTLSDDDDVGYPLVNRFRVDGEDLVFIAEGSSNFVYIDVSDGQRFSPTAQQETIISEE